MSFLYGKGLWSTHQFLKRMKPLQKKSELQIYIQIVKVHFFYHFCCKTNLKISIFFSLMRVWLNIPGCCSAAQLCLTLCNRIECSMQGLPVLHYLPELAQTPVHWVSDAIWPSRSLPSPSLAFNLCQHTMSQLFTSCGQSIGAWASASVIPMNIQDWLPLGWIAWISLESKGLLRVFSNTTVQKHQFSSVTAFFMVWLSHPYMTIGDRTSVV